MKITRWVLTASFESENAARMAAGSGPVNDAALYINVCPIEIESGELAVELERTLKALKNNNERP